MPASIVQQNTGFANSGSLTATLGAGAAAGRTLLIAVASIDTITQPSGFATDATVDHGTIGKLRLFRKATTAGETSWGITLGGTYGGAWWAAEVAGLDTSPLDKTATATGTSSSPSTGTTPTTAQADEWALAVIAAFSAGSTPSFSAWTNSFSEISDAGSSGSTWKQSLGIATRDLAATGAFSSGATLSPLTYWAGAIATYKVAAAQVNPSRFMPFFA